jgi:hypothetical protein
MSGLGEDNREDIWAIQEHWQKLWASLMPWILCRSSKDDIQKRPASDERNGLQPGNQSISNVLAI